MFNENIYSNLGLALLCTSSAVALSSAAHAQSQASGSETVVVTGSRVISDAANSPTPLTIVTTAQLQATTPTSLPDALGKLPEFMGSDSARTTLNSVTNAAADSLDLRNLGPERTLVLFDGKRAVSSTQDGTIDVSALPQMLVQRVDVVTGGASAVYGSDAVTGVVNFVLDKHFTGWKVDANAGISNYSDGATENLGIAAGSDLFGGRGHIEGDVRAYHADVVQNSARPGTNRVLTGLGTASNPYVFSQNVVDTTATTGGKITCTGCAANGMQFVGNGTIGPFTPGSPTGSGGLSVGGDGWVNRGDLAPLQSAEESFGRFSYNINDDTTFYIQGSVNESYTKARIVNNGIQTGATPSTFFVNNPYLPAAAQAALANPSGAFTVNVDWANQGPWGAEATEALVDTQSGTVGFDGALGNYAWSLFYTHGASRTRESNPHNINQQREWAANDAVAGPGGTVQCYVSTTTYASLYPGCVPINTFGPNALTSEQYNYFTFPSYWTEIDTLDDLGGSISGDVVNDWAGAIKGALSFESRWQSLATDSTVQAGVTPVYVNCTGLRLCNTSTTFLGGTALTSFPAVSENVWEIAGELNVPLLKDVPLVQDLSVDLAGRYTDYSTSGSVETWKIGLDYHVNDELRLRATNSVDIRAPNLYELYAPNSFTHTSLIDPHTQSTANPTNEQTGNPNLKPEIGRTYTAGVVYTPEFIPGLTASVDYYRINMTGVIDAVVGSNPTILQLCENSGGTASFCALIQRPLPFSNTTTNNAPTLVVQEALNAAFQRTEGWDIELDYGFQLGDVWADAPGSVSLRMLANITPVMESQPFPGSPLTFTSVEEVTYPAFSNPGSKGHVTSFLDYNVGSWSFNLLDRWVAGFPKQSYYGIDYVNPRVNSVNYQDVTIDKKFDVDGETIDGYLSIQNVGNVLPPLALVTTNKQPNFQSYGITGYDHANYDEVGRFFTLGVRARF